MCKLRIKKMVEQWNTLNTVTNQSQKPGHINRVTVWRDSLNKKMTDWAFACNNEVAVLTGVHYDAVHSVTDAGRQREERRVVWQWPFKLVCHVTFFSYEVLRDKTKEWS